MGWFKKEDKPQEGEINWVNLPEEDGKLSGGKIRPVIITEHNNDDSSRVLPCTTKNHPDKGDIKVTTKPTQMDTPTYVRVSQEEDVEDKDLEADPDNRRVTDDLWKKLKKLL